MNLNLQETSTLDLTSYLRAMENEIAIREHNNKILPLLVSNLIHLYLKEPANDETKFKILYHAQLIHNIKNHTADLLEQNTILRIFNNKEQLINQVSSIQNQEEIYALIIENLEILKTIETKHSENIQAIQNNPVLSKSKKNYELIQKISSNLQAFIGPLFLLSIIGGFPLMFIQYFFIPHFSLTLFSLSCILIGLGFISFMLEVTTHCLNHINQKNVFQKEITQEKIRFFDENKSTRTAQESNLQDICKDRLVC